MKTPNLTLFRTAGVVLLATSAVLPGVSFAGGFHFDSICRSDPTANKNTVTLILHGEDSMNADSTTNYQVHAPLAGVTVNALWTYVDYRQNHAVFKYQQDSCTTAADGSCTFHGGSGRARWQLSEVVGYNMSSPASDAPVTETCPNTLMIDFW